MTKHRNTPVDRAIGARIRQLRLARGMSQGDLGDKLGLTYQQVQKYETGVNAIASSRMAVLADALGVSATDLLSDGANASGAPAVGLSSYAIRVARRIDRLSVRQRRALVNILDSWEK